MPRYSENLPNRWVTVPYMRALKVSPPIVLNRDHPKFPPSYQYFPKSCPTDQLTRLLRVFKWGGSKGGKYWGALRSLGSTREHKRKIEITR